MKPCFILFGILFCCSVLCPLRAELEASATIAPNWMLEFEAGLGSASPLDIQSGEMWKMGTAIKWDVNYVRPVSTKLQVHGGIGYQYSYSHRLLHHPLPYMMTMDVVVKAYSFKFMAGADYALHRPHNGIPYVYAGGGLYADHVYDAGGNKKIKYVSVSDNQSIDIDMNDSFPVIMPGFQLALGLRTANGRLELSHWQDLKTFSVPGVPMGKQCRLGIGINLAYNIPSPFAKNR